MLMQVALSGDFPPVRGESLVGAPKRCMQGTCGFPPGTHVLNFFFRLNEGADWE